MRAIENKVPSIKIIGRYFILGGLREMFPSTNAALRVPISGVEIPECLGDLTRRLSVKITLRAIAGSADESNSLVVALDETYISFFGFLETLELRAQLRQPFCTQFRARDVEDLILFELYMT